MPPTQATAPTATTGPSSPTSSNFPAQSNGTSVTGSPPKQSLPPSQMPGNAQPMQMVASGSRPNFITTPRNRSPSGPPSLSDLAHQGRKALKGLLQDGGNRPGLNSMRDGLGGDAKNSTYKGVKAKREADDADKEYRRGVHWLETLRLRRANTIRSGYTVRVFQNRHDTALTTALALRAWKISSGRKAQQ